MQRAVELEAYNRAERQRTDNIRVMNKDSTDTAKVSKIDQFMETVEKNMRPLQKDMRDLKQWKFQSQNYKPQSQGSMNRQNNSKPQDRSKVRKCYNCCSDEHLKRNCPMPPKERSENGQKMLDSSNASRNESLQEGRDNPTDGQCSRVVRSLIRVVCDCPNT